MESLNRYHKYLKNELSASESDDFTRAMVKTYFEEEALKTRWKVLLKEEYNFFLQEKPAIVPVSPPTKKLTLTVIGTIIAIAACLLLMWNIFVPTETSTSDPVQQLLSEHYSKPFTRDVLKGTNGNLLTTRNNAYNFYQNKNYQSAIPLFEELVKVDEPEEGDYFFLGLSYLYHQDAEKAIPYFKTILEQAQSNYSDAATWYLGLALTDAKKYEEAREYLKQVTQWNGNQGKRELAKDAAQLLETISGK